MCKILFLLLTVVAWSSAEPTGFLRLGNKQYISFLDQRSNQLAVAFCKTMGAGTAVVRTQEEMEALRPLIEGGNFWLDTHKDKNDGVYRYTGTNEAINASLWDDGQPSCAGDKCGVVLKDVYTPRLEARPKKQDSRPLCVIEASITWI